jgi:hypothetical protein
VHARRPFLLTTKLCMRSPIRARFLLDPVVHADLSAKAIMRQVTDGLAAFRAENP